MEAVSFILEIVVPVVATIAVLSRISGARQNEERYYALVGLLATKGILNMDDLMTLQIFAPREDILKQLLDLAGG